MKIEFQRKVDRIAGSLLCRILSLIPRGRGRPPVEFQPKRILIILPSEMGSLILARSMFEKLQAKYPQSSLYVLVFKQNKEVLDILRMIPEERILTIRNGSFGVFVKDTLIVLRRLRKIQREHS